MEGEAQRGPGDVHDHTPGSGKAAWALCPQGRAAGWSLRPGPTSGASPGLREATQRAERRPSSTRQPPVPLPRREELSISRDWAQDRCVRPDRGPKEKEDWQVLPHSEAGTGEWGAEAASPPGGDGPSALCAGRPGMSNPRAGSSPPGQVCPSRTPGHAWNIPGCCFRDQMPWPGWRRRGGAAGVQVSCTQPTGNPPSSWWEGPSPGPHTRSWPPGTRGDRAGVSSRLLAAPPRCPENSGCCQSPHASSSGPWKGPGPHDTLC
ncbi:hypothetical protein VULLAG_LOCUS21942 [Vulpes lagopus]